MEQVPSKVFIFDNIRVFFKHTDFYGYVHPYNYLEWTSYVREAFFSKMCGDFRKILNSPIKMMTAKISAEVKGDSKFGDEIEARFTICKVKKVSFDVIVRFFNITTQKIVCETRHTLVFLDSEKQRFTSIPEDIKKPVVQYEEFTA